MKTNSYNIELVTPCFCAGANQAQAEIRPASIRGQLRWWFRAMGGSKEEESSVFGAIAGDAGRSSSLLVRVRDIKSGPVWTRFPMNMGSPGAYLWFYASVSGKERGSTFGPRWNALTGHYPPASRFVLDIVWIRNLPNPELQLKFDHALEAFLRFGGLGLRLTRGMGALHCLDYQTDLETTKARAGALFKSTFAFKFRDQFWAKWEDAVFDAELWLKNDLRKEFNATKVKSSPLGNSVGPRQTSAVYFRPIKFSDGRFSLLIFEAPHSRVLESKSRRPAPVIENRPFTGPAPKGAPAQVRRY